MIPKTLTATLLPTAAITINKYVNVDVSVKVKFTSQQHQLGQQQHGQQQQQQQTDVKYKSELV